MINLEQRHSKWMSFAFSQAQKAYDSNEVPVGAVVVYNDKIIGRGHNQKEQLNDPTAHAEIIAITAATNTINDWRLIDCELYVTKEPCPMCAGAIINSRIRSVLGTQRLQTLLSEERGKQMALIQDGVNTEAEKFGIEIVDVRIKRADLPPANSDAIYRRMQTEREREAKEFRAKGAEMAITITSTADKEVTVILADAEKQSQILKGEGDGQRN